MELLYRYQNHAALVLITNILIFSTEHQLSFGLLNIQFPGVFVFTDPRPLVSDTLYSYD